VYKSAAGQRLLGVQLRLSITAGEHRKKQEDNDNDQHSVLEKITVAPVNAMESHALHL
jgi:hypothetical protein